MATVSSAGSATQESSRVVGRCPRRRMSWVNDARCSWLSTRGTGDDGALAGDLGESAVGDEAGDGGAHRRAADPVMGHEVALGRDHRAGGELAVDRREQRLAQLHVLRDGAVDQHVILSANVSANLGALVRSGTYQ